MAEFAAREASVVADLLIDRPEDAVERLRSDLQMAPTLRDASELISRVNALQTPDNAGQLVIGPVQAEECGLPGTRTVTVQYDRQGQPVEEVVARLQTRPVVCDVNGNMIDQSGPYGAFGRPRDGFARYGYGYEPYNQDQNIGNGVLGLVEGLFIMNAFGSGSRRFTQDDNWYHRQNSFAESYRSSYGRTNGGHPSEWNRFSKPERIVAPVINNTTINNNITNHYGKQPDRSQVYPPKERPLDWSKPRVMEDKIHQPERRPILAPPDSARPPVRFDPNAARLPRTDQDVRREHFNGGLAPRPEVDQPLRRHQHRVPDGLIIPGGGQIQPTPERERVRPELRHDPRQQEWQERREREMQQRQEEFQRLQLEKRGHNPGRAFPNAVPREILREMQGIPPTPASRHPDQQKFAPRDVLPPREVQRSAPVLQRDISRPAVAAPPKELTRPAIVPRVEAPRPQVQQAAPAKVEPPRPVRPGPHQQR